MRCFIPNWAGFRHAMFVCTAAISLTSISAYGTTIASWDFTNPAVPADAANVAVYPNLIAPTVGTGNAGGTHASATTDWTTPSGNGSADSFSANEWTVGDYFQFSLSTTGFSQVYVGYYQTGSNTGPRDFQLQYSSTGVAGPFTSAGSYMITNDGWTTTPPPNEVSFHGFDLSSVASLANNANVAFRITSTSTTAITGGTVAAAGTGRVDDFVVADTPVVPEPTSVGALLFGAAAILSRRRAR